MEAQSHELTNEQLRAKVEEKNRILKEGTRRQKRILIAQDVIDLIDANTIRVNHTGFFRIMDPRGDGVPTAMQEALGVDLYGRNLPNAEGVRVHGPIDKEKVRAAFERAEILAGCQVCALGACMVSAVRLFNQFAPSLYSGGCAEVANVNDRAAEEGNLIAYLAEFFDEQQLAEIEAAYERGEGFYNREHRLVAIEREAESSEWTDYLTIACSDEECSQAEHEVRVEHSKEQPGYNDTEEWWKDAVAYGRDLTGPDSERLRAIMQNVIDNDGLFVTT